MDGRNPLHLVLAGLSVVITLQIGGFALLWSKDTPPPEYVYLAATTDKTTADSPVNTPVVVVSPPDEKALRQIIKTVLEQELAAYAHQLSATPQTAQKVIPAVPGIKENSPENIQHLNSATNIARSAVANGKWTHSDSAAMLTHSHYLTLEQRLKLIDELLAAVNRQELKLDEAIPAF